MDARKAMKIKEEVEQELAWLNKVTPKLIPKLQCSVECFINLLQNNSVNAFIDSFQIHMKDLCCLVAERELTDEVLKCIFNLFNASANSDYFAVINDERIHDPNAMKNWLQMQSKKSRI